MTPRRKNADITLGNIGIKRLMREAKELSRPSQYISAVPVNDNLYLWHFTIRGAEDSPYEDGIYHGEIRVHPEFEPICISSSNFHPELWQPSWGIRTIITALIGFMPTPGNNAVGAIESTESEKRCLAVLEWVCDLCGVKNESILLDVEADQRETAVIDCSTAKNNYPNSEPDSDPKNCPYNDPYDEPENDLNNDGTEVDGSDQKDAEKVLRNVVVRMETNRLADLTQKRLEMMESLIEQKINYNSQSQQKSVEEENDVSPVNVGWIGFHEFSKLVEFSMSPIDPDILSGKVKIINGPPYTGLESEDLEMIAVREAQRYERLVATLYAGMTPFTQRRGLILMLLVLTLFWILFFSVVF